MRRYGVRILVAVLTFLLGVALSFGLGLFRVRETHHHQHWRSKRERPKLFVQTHNHPFVIYNDGNAPLQLTYLGPTSETAYQQEQMLQILVENRSNQTISSFSLGGERFGSSFELVDGKTNMFLGPGQSHLSLLPNNAGSRTELWLSQVEFQDRSTWSNPRNLR